MDIVANVWNFLFLFFFLDNIDKQANTRCYEKTKKKQKKKDEKLGEILVRHEKLYMIKQKILRDLTYCDCAD